MFVCVYRGTQKSGIRNSKRVLEGKIKLSFQVYSTSNLFSNIFLLLIPITIITVRIQIWIGEGSNRENVRLDMDLNLLEGRQHCDVICKTHQSL